MVYRIEGERSVWPEVRILEYSGAWIVEYAASERTSSSLRSIAATINGLAFFALKPDDREHKSFGVGTSGYFSGLFHKFKIISLKIKQSMHRLTGSPFKFLEKTRATWTSPFLLPWNPKRIYAIRALEVPNGELV